MCPKSWHLKLRKQNNNKKQTKTARPELLNIKSLHFQTAKVSTRTTEHLTDVNSFLPLYSRATGSEAQRGKLINRLIDLPNVR